MSLHILWKYLIMAASLGAILIICELHVNALEFTHLSHLSSKSIHFITNV